MNIENMQIDELQPYERNSKKHPAEQIDKIAKSIEEFGFLVPILIDDSNSIIAGHGRLMAARKLGLDEVPTISVSHLTDAQIRAYRIADNKLTESAWDIELLSQEVEELKLDGFDIDLTGFDEIEIGELLKDDTTESKYHDGSCENVEFIDDEETALTIDPDDKKRFENKSIIVVTFSGGKDSSFVLLWAKHVFPDKRIIAVFSDTGVEMPGMAAHAKTCCDFVGAEFVLVKPKKDMLAEIESRGWPNILFAWCQQEFIYRPVHDYQLTLSPEDIIIIDGSSASQATAQSKKTKTSKPLDKRMKNYDYYHPAFDVSRDVIESILVKSGMPIWDGYRKGFVRTSCWMCIGMNGLQAVALNDNYPGLVQHIRDMERKTGKKLKELQGRSIDDLIVSGEKKRKNKAVKNKVST